MEQTTPTSTKLLLFPYQLSLPQIWCKLLAWLLSRSSTAVYVHAGIYFYEKSQNLTPPTHSLHSLTLNGHCYGNNSLTQNLERHLARIMKEEMRHWVKPCVVSWSTVAPFTDCFRTPRGPCHLWSVTFCPAQCRKQLSLALALSLFFAVLTVNGLSAIWSNRTEFAVQPAWSSKPLPE